MFKKHDLLKKLMDEKKDIALLARNGFDFDNIK